MRAPLTSRNPICFVIFAALAVFASACDREMVNAGQYGPGIGSTARDATANETVDTSVKLPWAFVRPQEQLVHLQKAVRAQSAASIRFITVTHIYNAKSDERFLNLARAGIAKTINSLSLAPALYMPVAVDPRMTVYGIDLQAIGWDATLWDELTRDYPYQVLLDDPAYDSIKNATNSATPVVNADWFIRKVMTPSIYYRILKTPETLSAFEQKLGVNTVQNIQNRDVIRAGYSESMVADGSRVIERHRQGVNGFLWRSYEFGGSTSASKDVVRNPLGPTQARLPFNRSFDADGGEFIYTLPNGMLGFFVVGKNGQRLEAAPEVESEGRRFAPAVAINCLKCHSRGLIFSPGQVSARKFTGPEAELIAALYPGDQKVNQALSTDSNRYREKLTALGVDLKDVDPVVALFKFYEADLSPALVAAELFLQGSTPVPSMSRAEFEASFPSMWLRNRN